MKAKKENIAVHSVTTSQGDDPYSPDNLLHYHVSLGLIEKLVTSGQLSQSDLNKSRRILTRKYAIPQDSIFAEIA